MAKDKDTVAAPARGNAPGTAQPATPAASEPAKRTRLSFSKDKKLAYAVAGLVAILFSKPVAAILSEEQKAKVAKAKTMADELGGGDPLKPVVDRIKAIQKELEETQKLLANPDTLSKGIAQMKELSNELDRQGKRKAQIEEMIAG